MKMTRKQTVGENLLYVMVWAAIILVPVLNSQMMSELHISSKTYSSHGGR